MVRNLSFLIILFFVSNPSSAQRTEFGFGVGANYYKGDLQPSFKPFTPQAAGNLFVRYNLNRTISFKAELMGGKLAGNDSKSGDPYLESRGFRFKNTIADFTAQIEYNFLNFRTHNSRYEHDWTPYLAAGIGYSNAFKRNIMYQSNSSILEKNISGIVIPYGVGFKKILTPRVNLSGEFSTRIFLNGSNGRMLDGLDGVNNSNLYNEKFTLNNKEYIQWPNTLQKDKYFNISIKLSYLIYKVNCNNLY